MDNAKTIVKEDVEWKDDAFSTAENADAVVVLTEWDEFRGLDLNKLKLTMKGSDLFDGRNIYEPDDARKAGLTYHGIGL